MNCELVQEQESWHSEEEREQWLAKVLAAARERVAGGELRKRPLRNALHVLSIDGGGIKGLVPLHMLLHAEKLFASVSRTGKSFIKQFNFFTGTSTGSIIAASLVKGAGSEFTVHSGLHGILVAHLSM